MMGRFRKFLFLFLGLVSLTLYNNCAESPFEAGRTASSDSQAQSTTPNPTTTPEPSLGPDNPSETLPPTAPPTTTPPPPPMPPAPNPPPTSVRGAAFMAVGHMGSSMFTCDGGQTWQGYRSADDDMRCWQPSHNNYDCDHAPTSSLGVTWGPQGFMASFGWGSPGHVEISQDGSNWQTVDTGHTWAGLAYGNGYYILNDRQPLRSSDGGAMWSNAGELNFVPWNARRIDFVNQGAGVFISQAQSAERDLMVSFDNGATFVRPANLPASCGNGDLAYNGQRILILAGEICTSDDQGATWTAHGAPPFNWADSLIHDGQSFKVYRGNQIHSSTDGISWSQSTVNVSNPLPNWSPNIDKVSYHNGEYVAVSQGWNAFYEQTQFLYSSDGINWTRVDKSMGDAPATPHPIRAIAPGELSACN